MHDDNVLLLVYIGIKTLYFLSLHNPTKKLFI